jgi:dihydroorotate dehydrogenase electron transfer subunit
VGGGVGVAPLLYLGAVLKQSGVEPTFLLGARTENDLLMIDEFRRYGRVLVTTEDGSMGERGFVTNHSVLRQEHFSLVQCCGPTPMMKTVARYARQSATKCEVSLENLMACGLGACLCCVEKVKARPDAAEATNVCVCKEGPVFNIRRLLWQD